MYRCMFLSEMCTSFFPPKNKKTTTNISIFKLTAPVSFAMVPRRSFRVVLTRPYVQVPWGYEWNDELGKPGENLAGGCGWRHCGFDGF